MYGNAATVGLRLYHTDALHARHVSMVVVGIVMLPKCRRDNDYVRGFQCRVHRGTCLPWVLLWHL